LPVFEPDDGRTFAGADASIVSCVVFIAFFLKPLSVTLPYAARFATLGDSDAAREVHLTTQRKQKTVTVAKGQKGDAGAVFDLAPKVGSVSDKRAANGGVAACIKKAKKTTMRRAAAFPVMAAKGGLAEHDPRSGRDWRGSWQFPHEPCQAS